MMIRLGGFVDDIGFIETGSVANNTDIFDKDFPKLHKMQGKIFETKVMIKLIIKSHNQLSVPE